MSKNKNYKTSKEYEQLVLRLMTQNFEGIEGVNILNITHDIKLQGTSGHIHQIDVCYKFRIWTIDFLVIVECKQYGRKVSIEDLLTFQSRINDLNANKGVFVTTVGFQSGAIKYAKSNGISLLIANGTKSIAVNYLRTHVPLRTKLKRENELIYNISYSSNENIGVRPFLRSSKRHLLYSFNNVSCYVNSEELSFSMYHRESCRFGENTNSQYFNTPNQDRIKTNKLLKILIIEQILNNNITKANKV